MRIKRKEVSEGDESGEERDEGGERKGSFLVVVVLPLFRNWVAVELKTEKLLKVNPLTSPDPRQISFIRMNIYRSAKVCFLVCRLVKFHIDESSTSVCVHNFPVAISSIGIFTEKKPWIRRRFDDSCESSFCCFWVRLPMQTTIGYISHEILFFYVLYNTYILRWYLNSK